MLLDFNIAIVETTKVVLWCKIYLQYVLHHSLLLTLIYFFIHITKNKFSYIKKCFGLAMNIQVLIS